MLCLVMLSVTQANAMNNQHAIISELNISEFINLSITEYEHLCGEKLSIRQKIDFHVNKLLLKKGVRKGSISMNASLHSETKFKLRWGPFFAGFVFGFLGIIGVAIFAKRPRRDAILSTVIGFGAIIFIAFLGILSLVWIE